MKSEHRHDLQTNELSAGLARWIENIKPFTGQIVTALVLMAVLYAGLSVWEAQSAQQERAAWEAFAYATDTGDPELKSLQVVAGEDQYAGTKMQEWAYVNWADRQVLLAMGSYLTDRENTQNRLRDVTGFYKEYAKSASDPQVRNRARYGLARVNELQNKLDEARQQYLTVRGELQLQAEMRAKQLDSDEVREVCSWLATTELPKRDLTGGQGATGERPDFDASLPAVQPTTDGISAESLEELLGDLAGDSPDSDREESENSAETDDSTETEASADANDDGGSATQ